jgi:hypothetical protein
VGEANQEDMNQSSGLTEACMDPVEKLDAHPLICGMKPFVSPALPGANASRLVP